MPQLPNISTEWLIDGATSIAVALLVLLAGWMLADIVSRRLHLWLLRVPRVDTTIAPVVGELSRYAIIAVTIVMVLGQFGVQTASILAILGAIGLAIALALQGTLSNMAAGIMLLWLRPFNVGEYIDGDGVAGTVVQIGLFATRLRTYDGVYVFCPNSRLWNARITNFSREKTRMIETRLVIAYGASIAEARKVLLGAAAETKVLDDPAPSVFVNVVSTSGVEIVLRVWSAGGDWWTVKTFLAERTKTALEEAGIEIPYNRIDLNLRDMPAALKPPAGQPRP